jgi:low affinity Fe/Cu permease
MPRGMGTFERFSARAARWTGGTAAFMLALLSVVIWAATGPYFRYSDTWQLVINTGTTIVTFLMVFLIQRAQNKDALAIQVKLNELLAAVHGASNRLINIEDLSETEVEKLHRRYQKLVRVAKQEEQRAERHSIEEMLRTPSREGQPRLPDGAGPSATQPPDAGAQGVEAGSC